MEQHLNDLVFVKYNRALRRRFNLRKSIDPISLDESNEWLLRAINELDDFDNELVHEGDDLTWADVSRASGVEKAHYATRSNAPTPNLTKSRSRATTLNAPIEPDEEEERYDVQEEDIGDDVFDDGNMEMLDLDLDDEDDF